MHIDPPPRHMATRGAIHVTIWFVLSLPAAAQSGNQGSIEGTLTDPSGLPVAAVHLDALHIATGTHFKATSNEQGIFPFPVLPVSRLAWSPWNDHRLLVRSGYGPFYVSTPAILSARPDFQNGISVQPRTFPANDPATRTQITAYPNSVCGPPDTGGSPPSCPPPAVGGAPPVLMSFSSAFRQPYVQQGSLAVEGEVTKGVAVSAAYVVYKGTRLQRVRDVNLGAPSVATAIGIAGSVARLTFQKFTLPRPMPGFDRVFLIESAAGSIYHGLAVQVRKSYSNGFQIVESYTRSKVIDDNPNGYAVNPGVTDSWPVADLSDPGADRAPGDNDQQQRLALSGILELRSFASLPSLAKHILSNWQLSWILTAQSGCPISDW